MNIKLLCFTKDNEVIGLCTNNDLITVLQDILIEHTRSLYEQFDSINEIV